MFAWLAFDDWATSEVLNLYFCRICSAGFFLCPKIICSRPASWDCHFINRNRCLEKLQGLVVKGKTLKPDSFVNPSLYFCAYVALCKLLSAFLNVLQFLFQYNYRNVPLISQGSYRHDMSWNNDKAENSSWNLLSIMLQNQPLLWLLS